MCSVIGVYSRLGEDVSAEAFVLADALKHRGPDSFGFKTPESEVKGKSLKGIEIPKSPVILGHCLLSTTGFGVQPLSCGKISISHNGQVYNYKEINPLENDLVSDSQVIAEFLGNELKNPKSSFESAVKKFMSSARGEYSVGVLFGNKLFAFRDFLGFKPLWFGENEKLFAFASEPGALRKIDIEFPVPLKPGHLLEVSENGFFVKKVFDLQDFRKSVGKKSSGAELKIAFEDVMDVQCRGLEKAAVLFSGGIDSSLIARAVSMRVPDTKLFVAGVDGSHDVVEAEKSARLLNIPLEKIILSENDVQGLSLEAISILGFFDSMQVAIGVPELACAKVIRASGYTVVFSGQGSDEVFCGYSNYAKILAEKSFKEVESEIWFSVSRMWSRNFFRDDVMVASQSLELRVPLMDSFFLRSAMAIPAKEKIRSSGDSLRKHPVRELAVSLGVPSSIASKPKKALQYGSGVQKIVSKLFRGS